MNPKKKQYGNSNEKDTCETNGNPNGSGTDGKDEKIISTSNRGKDKDKKSSSGINSGNGKDEKASPVSTKGRGKDEKSSPGITRGNEKDDSTTSRSTKGNGKDENLSSVGNRGNDKDEKSSPGSTKGNGKDEKSLPGRTRQNGEDQKSSTESTEGYCKDDQSLSESTVAINNYQEKVQSAPIGLQKIFDLYCKSGEPGNSNLRKENCKEWLETAGLIGKNTGCSEKEFEEAFNKTAEGENSLDYCGFKKFIESICKEKKKDPQEFFDKLIIAGPPKDSTETV